MTKKTANSLKRFAHSGESGQATLEYILILTVTVIIFLSLIWQFNTAFRKYADAFFDGYIGCLLETGELPGNGGDCEAEYQKFQIKNGTVLAGDGAGGGGSGGGGTGSGSGGSNNSDKDSSGGKGGKESEGKKSANNKGGGSSNSNSAGGGSELGGSSASGGSLFVKSRNGKQRSTPVAGAKVAGAGNNKGREGLTALGSVDSTGNGGDNGGRRRRTALDRSFGYEGQRSEEDQALTAPSTTVAKEEGGGSLKPKKVSVDTSRKPASIGADNDEGFSLGKFIRIILIAGIVVMIFIFFGGQILQISKSAEK